MKFVSYQGHGGARRTGVLLQGEEVVDASDLLSSLQLEAGIQQALDTRGIEPAAGGLLRWAQAGAQARQGLAAAIQERIALPSTARQPLASLTLLPPLARPGKIVGVGRNYADHAKETGVDPFEKPRIIFKVPSSIAAPGATVAKPALVQKMDFEGELAVVMGGFASRVSQEAALSYVAGYTLLNDLSAREFQFDIAPPQTTFAKSMDGFCPLGPALVSADEIPDPQVLHLRTHVNGVLMQEATTADMLFPVATLISYLSQYMTLEPGDVLATGTPAGIGAFRKPPQYLGAGDWIEVRVDRIGTLRTLVA